MQAKAKPFARGYWHYQTVINSLKVGYKLKLMRLMTRSSPIGRGRSLFFKYARVAIDNAKAR
jgi:hypothetical protein